MSQSTPKFKSAEFKEAVAALKETFDAHALGIVLLDALERKAAEQIFRKHAPPAGVARAAELPRPALCGQLTGWFFASEEVAYQVMKELDRACQKERHIVASIPEAQAPERVGSYRAIALKRERAKFVWALARDERPSVRKLAARIINEFFEEVADMEKARSLTRGDGTASVEDVELARRLQAQAERLSEATNEVSDLQTRLGKFEDDRARLLAEIGVKERMLKQAFEAREGLDVELKRLRSTLSDVENKQREAELARAAEREARAMADDLAAKVRRLEKLAGAAENLGTVQAELEAAQKKNEDLSRQLARTEQAHKREREELDKERGRLRSELEELREDLRRTRRHIAELESGAAAEQGAERKAEENSVLMLLDQANLAASASSSYRRKVDFAGLLDRLRGGRPLFRALAFVVDNGGAQFDAFCDTLKKSGWDLRIKKPKRFADGTHKADWDMGIAIEGIEQSDRADVVVLISGDGDFAPLVRHLKRRGRRVEVAAFPDGLAGELASAADRIHSLDASVLE